MSSSTPLPSSSTPTSPPPSQDSTNTLSELGARRYYHGLPSAPPLVGRSNTTPSEAGIDEEGNLKRKGLRPIGTHALNDTWEGGLVQNIFAHLKAERVAVTSIDPVKIGYEDEYPYPVVLWIGVLPGSLSLEEGNRIAIGCREILVQAGITDVDVEMRGSRVRNLVLDTRALDSNKK